MVICNKKKYKAQGLVEYILVFLVAALVMFGFASLFDFSKLKSFAVYGLRDKDNPAKITIPAMTD